MLFGFCDVAHKNEKKKKSLEAITFYSTIGLLSLPRLDPGAFFLYENPSQATTVPQQHTCILQLSVQISLERQSIVYRAG